MSDPSSLQEGAYADVIVKIGLVKLLQKEFDLCEEAYVFVMSVLFGILAESYLGAMRRLMFSVLFRRESM